MKNNNHCCDKMSAELKEQEYPPTPFIYNSYFREYLIKVPDSHSVFCIAFCPMCGKKLPASLRDEWYDTLEVMNLDPDDPQERKKIPKDFFTDEWWKKRGL